MEQFVVHMQEYICVYTNAYMHVTTISKKTDMSLKENKKVCLGGYAVREGEEETI